MWEGSQEPPFWACRPSSYESLIFLLVVIGLWLSLGQGEPPREEVMFKDIEIPEKQHSA